MPTSTRQGSPPRNFGAGVAGLSLYLINALVELGLGGTVRWIGVYLAALITRTIVPGTPDPGALALTAAALPIVHSLLGLVWPGRGRWWQRRAGIRRATAEEVEAVWLALDLIGTDVVVPRMGVLDQPCAAAAVRGSTLVVSRALLGSASLAAVLVHEYGHLHALDGRLSEALARLKPCGDHRKQQREGCQSLSEESVGLGNLMLRGLMAIALGRASAGLMRPAWALYWRRREFAADRYAAVLGHGEDLVSHLRDEVLPFEFSRPVWLFDPREHPPTAHRIERLQRVSARGGTN